MPGNRLIGSNGSLEFTLEGLLFFRSTSGAAARGTERVHQVAWDRITRADLTERSRGKPVLRVSVADTAGVATVKQDPHALKVKRKHVRQAQEFVALVNDEIERRSRWRKAEADQGTQPPEPPSATSG